MKLLQHDSLWPSIASPIMDTPLVKNSNKTVYYAKRMLNDFSTEWAVMNADSPTNTIQL